MAGSIHAQKVFKKYGVDKEPVTLSKGRYVETFTNDEVVQIGTVLLNTKTNKVIKFLDEDTITVSYQEEYASRFVSIDPLAEKYPWLSPYAFCSNNPVNRIDPTGLTDYRITENGYIRDASTLWDKIKNYFTGPDKTDKLIASNGNTLTMDAGTMTEVKEYKKGDGKIGDYFKVSSDKVAEKIYEFVSENTKVEWGRTEVSDSKKTENIISTSHKASEESVVPLLASELLGKGYNVTELTHSHPQGGLPSGYVSGHLDSGDKNFVNYVNQYYPNNTTVHRVYDVQQKRYIYYNNSYIYKYENKK
jgi:hypothetical protein